jgi:hypothetical protein
LIVYAHRSSPLALPAVVSEFRHRLAAAQSVPSRDAVVDLFVDFGEAYAAAADADLPAIDDVDRDLDAWNQVLAALAHAVCACAEGDREGLARALQEASRRSPDLEPLADRLPLVPAKTAEGFAYFALYPEQYALAANDFVASAAPRTLTCLGLRGIGAPLAFVVAAAAERLGIRASIITARPRGHPFDRRLILSAALKTRLAEHASGHGAVVDEGPGLSGSSFAAGREALLDAGFAAERIALFPSWRTSGASLRSERGRRVFRDVPQFVADFDRVRPRDAWEDLSAGRWRVVVCGRDERPWPAVHPQHERRKHRSPDGRIVERFAGIGRHGRALRARAARLADAGYAAWPRGMDRGFLRQDWIRGTPVERITPDGLNTIAAYLAFLARTFSTGRRATTDDLAQMMRINGEAADGAAVTIDFAALEARAKAFDEPEVAIDGRMLPHDWLLAHGRLMKTDALDHHADDFLPGCRDIAWDVAGTIVEFELDDDAASALIDRYARVAGDAAIDGRLEFYVPAYAAYRYGYTALAAESLGGTVDGMRFTRAKDRYRRLLAAPARRPARARRR